MSTILDHFDALVKLGIQVIPLKEGSKAPLCKGWNKNWNQSECRKKIVQFPHSNIGILLGKIVDVEGDTPQANQIILDLIGDYPHPSYYSNKSIHHLFHNPDLKLRIHCYQDIEFRGFEHQSVLPPSQHKGIQYKWLDTGKFPIPEMPSRLFRFYEKIKHNRKHEIKPDHCKIRCNTCNKIFFLHSKRLKLELAAFHQEGSPWLCHKCRNVNLRPIVRKLRRN